MAIVARKKARDLFLWDQSTMIFQMFKRQVALPLVLSIDIILVFGHIYKHLVAVSSTLNTDTFAMLRHI